MIKGIMVKAVLSELNNFKTDKLEEYLNSKYINNEDVIDIINLTLSRPEIIQIRDIEKRNKRDQFINKLYLLTHKIDCEIKELIISKAALIINSEELFDKISCFIEECEISNRPEDIQVWAHLKRVESQFEILRNDIDEHLKHIPKNKIFSPYTIIKNKAGDEYSADAASENVINYLSITLHLLAYKFKWFNNGKIVLSDEENISQEDIFKAGSIELLAISWKEVEESSQRSLLFGGSVSRAEGDNVPEDAKEKGAKVTFHYERKESDYEIYDAISCERRTLDGCTGLSSQRPSILRDRSP